MATGPAPVTVPGLSTTNKKESTLMDKLEESFQDCLGPLISQDNLYLNETTEIKTDVEQTMQRFMDTARKMEAYFMQKRLLLLVKKPEMMVKEDILTMRQELANKEKLLQKHQQKLQHWHNMLDQHPGGPPMNQQQQHQQQQQSQFQQQSQQQQPRQVPNQQQVGGVSASNVPLQQRGLDTPLAYLEQTTSNIGLPDQRR